MALTATNTNVIAAKKQRKRIQNRLNQRARRQRLQLTRPEDGNASSGRRPYRVDRWRLDDSEPTSTPDANTQQSDNQNSLQDTLTLTTATASVNNVYLSEDSNTFPLPADHLLNLIQLNASRGLSQNKLTLLIFTTYYVPGHQSTQRTIHPDVLFYGSSLISTALDDCLPGTLIPTQPQLSLIHATWINILPFPRMRENLIKWETCFSHSEFICDIVGHLVDTQRLFSNSVSLPMVSNRGIPSQMVFLQGEDDEVTSGRNGLIVWGEPYRIESWEATPGFLRKWMWALEGCEELIESSNRWRMVRGEEPIRVLATGTGLVSAAEEQN
ncbi:hypothetical protein BDW59DRAFT_138735 [Aspergillus cavernicola]|uniref:BZIP domain-containing protein n=1 Tax=Aspergillus cavernicola TaxID=176166 RepID=A0ABR4IZZ5_9EURO